VPSLFYLVPRGFGGRAPGEMEEGG
jgi:hypothetical protein